MGRRITGFLPVTRKKTTENHKPWFSFFNQGLMASASFRPADCAKKYGGASPLSTPFFHKTAPGPGPAKVRPNWPKVVGLRLPLRPPYGRFQSPAPFRNSRTRSLRSQTSSVGVPSAEVLTPRGHCGPRTILGPSVPLQSPLPLRSAPASAPESELRYRSVISVCSVAKFESESQLLRKRGSSHCRPSLAALAPPLIRFFQP